MPLSWQVNSHMPLLMRGGDLMTGGASTRRNLIELPIRFANSWISKVRSPGTIGQPVDGDRRVAVLDRRFKLGDRLTGDLVEVDRPEVGPGLADPRECQQVVDQPLHALGAVDRVGDVLLGALVELLGVPGLEHLAEARHFAKRLLQVVRGDVGELLEIPVGTLEFRGLERQVVQAEDQLLAHGLHVGGEFHDLTRSGDVRPGD